MEQPAFSVDKVRAQFPALGGDQVFMDNAGGSQALGSVISAIQEYLGKTNVQLGATYSISQQSTDLYAKGYKAAAEFINASSDNIVLGGSTTQLFRNLSTSLSFPPGSEVILSKLDHEANITSWIDMASTQGLTVNWWHASPSDVDPDNSNPKLTPDNLRPLLSDRTVFVACTHASNILGSIHDIRELVRTVREVVPTALFCVDAVAYAPHGAIDVQELEVDFYSFSWYKVYGPHISQLYASPRALPLIRPLSHYFSATKTLADKLGLAASSYELVAGIPTVVSYFGASPSARAASWSHIKNHEHRLQSLLLEFLTSLKDSEGNERVRILGERDPDPEERVPTVSFVVKGKSSKDVVEGVDKAVGLTNGALKSAKDGDQGLGQSRQFGIRWGHFYSKRLCEEVLGLEKDGEGVVRVSLVHYNTEDEVKGLIEVLKRVIG